MVQEIEASRFVHSSVDNIVPATAFQDQPISTSGTGSNTPVEKDDEEDGADEDERSVANTRSPRISDGIASVDELAKIMTEILPRGLRSAYGSGAWLGQDETFSSRGGFERYEREGHEWASHLEGGDEPRYTCFTPLFRLTLGRFILLRSTPRSS